MSSDLWALSPEDILDRGRNNHNLGLGISETGQGVIVGEWVILFLKEKIWNIVEEQPLWL